MKSFILVLRDWFKSVPKPVLGDSAEQPKARRARILPPRPWPRPLIEPPAPRKDKK